MAGSALNPDWALGTLWVKPGVLPSWIARTGPIFIPVPRSALRPAGSFRAIAHVRTPAGDAPLVAEDGTALYDLERLERLIVSERAVRYRPRVYPTRVPPVVRRKIARVEHELASLLSSRARLTFSLGGDAIGALWTFTRDRWREHPWPSGRSAAFVVTHDVDERRPHDMLALARDEKALGIRATYFLVSSQWRGSDAVETLRSLGHEVACHGIDHSGREELAAPRELAEAASLGLQRARGYRSPRFACGPSHADKVGAVFQYDSSRPETRWAPRGPSWTGSGTIFPFVEGARLVQLPVTLPTDLDLLDAGMDWDQARIAWRAKWRLVEEGGGLAVLCTHVPAPGGPSEVLPFLESLLAQEDVWVGPACDLVSFLLEHSASSGALRPWTHARQRMKEASRSVRSTVTPLPLVQPEALDVR
jgi:peptidoglycan/xylan/chitin deacetylase (PgdA/CDA1 family)